MDLPEIRAWFRHPLDGEVNECITLKEFSDILEDKIRQIEAVSLMRDLALVSYFRNNFNTRRAIRNQRMRLRRSLLLDLIPRPPRLHLRSLSQRFGQKRREVRLLMLGNGFHQMLKRAQDNGMPEEWWKELCRVVWKYKDVFRISLLKDPPADVSPMNVWFKSGA